MVHSLFSSFSRKKYHEDNKSEIRKLQTQILDKIHQFQQLECEFRQEDHQAVQKSTCNFKQEDHARLSDTLMFSKTNEIFLKELAGDQDGMAKSLERIVDKFEAVARDLRNELNLFQESVSRKIKNK